MIGDFLYQLTPRDMASTGIELVSESFTLQGTNVVLAPGLDVPPEHVFILKAIQADANPGADTLTDFFLGVRDKGFTTTHTLARAMSTTAASGAAGVIEGLGIANQRVGINWIGEVYVKPESLVVAVAGFNLAVNNHIVNVSIFGLMIPRGTISM